MQSVLSQYVYLILIIMGMVMVADKLRVAYPIVLVVGGLLLSLVARFSHVGIDPELVFLIFLPPLLYEAAWQTSWNRHHYVLCYCVGVASAHSGFYLGTGLFIGRYHLSA
jgi:NhaP-type Na+/H+ or K+/H+ antiporter